MRSDETNASFTCAFSPRWVEKVRRVERQVDERRDERRRFVAQGERSALHRQRPHAKPTTAFRRSRRRSRCGAGLAARAVEERMGQLEGSVCELLEIHARCFDRNRRYLRVAAEHEDAVQHDGDPIRSDQRRSVESLDRETVQVRVAAQLEPAVGGSTLDERNLEARGQRTAGKLEPRLRRQVADVRGSGRASRSMSSVASRRSANGVVAPSRRTATR